MRRVALISLLCLFLWSCGGPELPFGETEPRLVVISEFSNDRTFEVQVSRARTVFDQDTASKYISNATVEIFRDTQFLGNLNLDPSRTPPAYTNSGIIPKSGVSYRIVVEAPGFLPVTAHSRIPSQILLRSSKVDDLREAEGQSSGETIYSYRIQIGFDDPAEETNFYHLNFFQQVITPRPVGEELPPAGSSLKIPNLNAVAGKSFIVVRSGGLLFNDDGFNGGAFSMDLPLSFTLRQGESLGKLLVELRAVSEDYYLFQKSLTQQVDGPGLPIQGDVPVYNNIQNGLGIFAGYNLSVDSVTVFR